MQQVQPIRELSGEDAATIAPALVNAGQPAVLRSVVSDWPAVRRARTSAGALVEYLRSLDSGALVDAVMTPPERKGRIFYNEGMDGFNFLRNRLTLSAVAEQVLRYSLLARSPAVAAQSAAVQDCIPGFLQDHALPLLGPEILPRIWLGNALTTPTHLDEWCNIACVVAGRRRFTLFPPEQVANLYVGPLDFAPTGAPVSLVDLDAPDFVRYPRFRQALASAQVAELLPGDAIYIPPLWWHNVQSLETFNMLVNYWWHADGSVQGQRASGFDCLLHAILGLRDLPLEARAAWAALFAHYVFGPGEPVTAHIPAARHGMLGALDAQQRAALRAELARRLDPPC